VPDTPVFKTGEVRVLADNVSVPVKDAATSLEVTPESL